MFNIKKKLGAVALLALFTIGSANATVLDTFNYGSDNFNYTLVNVGDSASTTIILDTLIPNTAYTAVKYDFEVTSNALGGGANLKSLSVADGLLSFSNDTYVGSAFSMTYGAVDGNNTPIPFPLDFTQYGDYFYFDLFLSDAAFSVDISVTSSQGFSQLLNFGAPAVSIPLSDEPLRFYLSFASFTGNAVFSDITSVVIDINAPANAELVIGEFGVIPEPGTLAIFGLALVGLAFGSRKKA